MLGIEACSSQIKGHAHDGCYGQEAENNHSDDKARLCSIQGQSQGKDKTHSQKHDINVDEGVEQDSIGVKFLEVFILGKYWGEYLVEEGVNGGKHGSNDEKL